MEEEKRAGNRKHYGHPPLPFIQSFLHASIFYPLLLYPFYVCYGLSVKYKDQLYEGFFEKDWFSIDKDISDNEWTFWWGSSLQLGALLSLYSLGGISCAKLFPVFEQKYFIVASVLSLWHILSTQGLLLILIHAVFFYVVLSLKSRKLLWIWVIPMIYGATSEGGFSLQASWFSIDSEYSDITQFSLMMSYLRLISFGCEVLADANIIVTFQDYVHYVMYLPMFFNGPILTYDLFSGQFKQPAKINLLEISVDLVSCIVYAFAINLLFHFVYTPSLCVHTNILVELYPMESVAIAWVNVVVFCIKYFIFYRFSGFFAKLNGFIPPGPPKCIATLYTFVDMWRYFDKGLYRFLQRYIYFPIGGSRDGFLKQIFASMLCFAFVGYWHESSLDSAYWGLTNWIGIAVEALLLVITSKLQLRTRLGGFVYRYVCAVFGSFSILALIYANNVFLIGMTPANILLYNVFSSKLAVLKLLGALYLSAHCTMDVN